MFNKGDQCKPKKFFFLCLAGSRSLVLQYLQLPIPAKNCTSIAKQSIAAHQAFNLSFTLCFAVHWNLSASCARLKVSHSHKHPQCPVSMLQTYSNISNMFNSSPKSIYVSLRRYMSLCIKLFQPVLWHRVAKFTAITSFNIIIINQLLSAIFNLKKRLTETSFLCMLVSRALATKDVLYRSPPVCTVLFSHQHVPSSSPLSFISSSGRIFLFFHCLIFPNPPDHIKLSRIVLRLHHCVNLLYENNTPTQYVNIFEKSVV